MACRQIAAAGPGHRALVGTVIADQISSVSLGRLFGVFALLVGLQLLRGSEHRLG